MNETESMAVFAIIEGLLEGDILLIQDKHEPPPMWKFPGGRVEPGESPEVALYRELFEEIGIVVLPVENEDIVSEEKTGDHIFRVYRARYYSGGFKPCSDEIDRVEAFSIDGARQLLSHSRILPKHATALQKYFILREKIRSISCDDYRFLTIAGPYRKDMPAKVQEMIDEHDKTCGRHDSPREHQADLDVFVTSEMEKGALELVAKLTAEA